MRRSEECFVETDTRGLLQSGLLHDQCGAGTSLWRCIVSCCWHRLLQNIEEACKATIRVVDKVPAKKPNTKVYDKAYPVYQGLYQSLKGDFAKIAAL